MPRTSTVPLTGTHIPVRLFASDEVGHLKVVESMAGAQPTISAKWGGVNRPQAVQAFSLAAPPADLLAIARADGMVELLDPTSLARRAFLPPSKAKPATADKGNGASPHTAVAGKPAIPAGQARQLAGVSLVRSTGSGAESSAVLVTCTKAGAVRVCAPFVPDVAREAQGAEGGDAAELAVVRRWDVLDAGKLNAGSHVVAARAHATGGCMAMGGKGLDVSVWDMECGAQTHAAKNVKPDHLGLVKPAWVTCLDFLDTDNPLSLVAGTAHGEVRIYDLRAQRRPVHVATLGEGPVSAVVAAPGRAPGSKPLVLAGNGHGVISLLDARAGFKPGGGFKGVTGAIRSLALHPTEPLVASVGLDRFVRIHDLRSRHLVSKVFLKQPLLMVAFDGCEDRLPVPQPLPGSARAVGGTDSKKRKAGQGGKKPAPPPADEDEDDDNDSDEDGDSDGGSEENSDDDDNDDEDDADDDASDAGSEESDMSDDENDDESDEGGDSDNDESEDESEDDEPPRKKGFFAKKYKS